MENLGQNKEFTLGSFSYNELEEATDEFKNEKTATTSQSHRKIYERTIPEGNRKVAIAGLENIEDAGETDEIQSRNDYYGTNSS